VTHGSSGAAVRVLAGSQGGTQGPIHTVNPGLLLDVVLPPGGGVRLEVPQGYTALAYVYDGAWASGPARVTLSRRLCQART
jgi:redox-sensitive bicupin YhaK (pirin superfamily)